VHRIRLGPDAVCRLLCVDGAFRRRDSLSPLCHDSSTTTETAGTTPRVVLLSECSVAAESEARSLPPPELVPLLAARDSWTGVRCDPDSDLRTAGTLISVRVMHRPGTGP